jgi:hypothetical protein
MSQSILVANKTKFNRRHYFIVLSLKCHTVIRNTEVLFEFLQNHKQSIQMRKLFITVIAQILRHCHIVRRRDR